MNCRPELRRAEPGAGLLPCVQPRRHRQVPHAPPDRRELQRRDAGAPWLPPPADPPLEQLQVQAVAAFGPDERPRRIQVDGAQVVEGFENPEACVVHGDDSPVSDRGHHHTNILADEAQMLRKEGRGMVRGRFVTTRGDSVGQAVAVFGADLDEVAVADEVRQVAVDRRVGVDAVPLGQRVDDLGAFQHPLQLMENG
jgi:hypothetical protein